ncbi:hypothetical protein [Aeromonas veronii]|uniref:Uncharacterized protein n=1 Tax=Aeromonas veronii TaxID=654 RepID=A0A2T4N610_AERVE|nr:hypothetical protein [Aeromonas veronii]PTH82295.1 hypothetical protein DAA48_02685 [Aeromonas veronii]RDE65483.1 hypothetical protein DV708_00475 [Aeromonas veronii]UJP33479.1 hypothetical protein K3G24_15230 [Aeromonas veronii]
MDAWEKLTNPTKLRANLMSASVYISSYEMCRDFIISKPKDFFTDNWGINGETLSEEYSKDVMSFGRSPLKASLLWFKEQGAISDTDIEHFEKAIAHRNEIAHNLPKFISEPDYEVDVGIFNTMLEVTNKIGVFWVMNYELSIHPDYSVQEIDEKGIQVGTIMMIKMMMQIAFGQEPEEGYYYNEIKKAIDKR